jgi:DNA-binding PadR family transcriptional regulator
MTLFNFKTTKKQIEIFEHNVAEILKDSFPQIKQALELSLRLYTIQFSQKPCGIFLSRDYSDENYKKILPEDKTNFDLYGLKVFNKKLQEFEDITLFFHNNFLTLIEVSDPEKFHKDYDYCKLEIGELSTKEIYSENLDKKHTLDILKNVSKDQLNQLDIEDAIEIEFNGNLYYTILDMEDGNFIAVDKTEKVYRLDHDHIETVKKIANNIEDFFDLYNGSKSNLIELMYEQTKTHSLYGNTN